MNKSIRIILKTIAVLLVFFVGVHLSYYFQDFFSNQIIAIFEWFNHIQFIFPKKFNFHFVPNYWDVAFGLCFTLFIITLYQKKLASVMVNIILVLVFFSIGMVSVSTLDAYLKIWECTACEDNVIQLNANDINYAMLTTISTVLSTLPFVIKKWLWKRKS